MEEKGMVKEKERVEEENRELSKKRRTGIRLCSICRKTGYNVRICPEAGLINNLSNSK